MSHDSMTEFSAAFFLRSPQGNGGAGLGREVVATITRQQGSLKKTVG